MVLWEYWDKMDSFALVGVRVLSPKKGLVVPVPTTDGLEGLLLRSELGVFWRHEKLTLV
jgi:hypothetical protein